MEIKEDGHVSFFSKHGNNELFTQVYEETNPSVKFEKMSGIHTLSDIAIDHIDPIYNTLNGNFPGLVKLTKIYTSMKSDLNYNPNGSERPKFKIVELLNETEKLYGGDKVNLVNELEADLKTLKNQIEYRLMDQKQNVKKNKN